MTATEVLRSTLLNNSHNEDDTDDDSEYDGARNAQLSTLYFLCSKDPEDEPYMWDQVRQWLQDHTHGEITDAAVIQGRYGITVVHLVCRNDGPMDIVNKLVEAAPNALDMLDAHGWLPLHYAAANRASDEMIELLVETQPRTINLGDNQGRVPLHFALSSYAEDLSIQCAKALVSTEAVDHKDDNQMTALHYACAYGSSAGALEVIVNALGDPKENPVDKSGRIPLHYICCNPFSRTAPDLAKFIIDLYPDSINMFDYDGNIPLRLFASKVKHHLREHTVIEELLDYPVEILDTYLKAKPLATPEFLTALQALPEWLRDKAVVTSTVQDILNHKISMRFPTAILYLDFVLYVLIIVSFSLCVPCSIQLRTLSENSPSLKDFDESLFTCTKADDTHTYVYILAGCSCYFLIRELAQILSLMSLGLIKTWINDYTNWLDAITIGSGMYFAGDMYGNLSDLRRFRYLASSALLIYWMALLSFLKSTVIEFSVFVGGLSNVLNRLLAFLTALFVILLTFTVIFVTIYFDSFLCTCDGDECGMEYVEFDHFCSFHDSFLKVYTMLLGEVSEEYFLVGAENEKFTLMLGIGTFAIFMILVVILLANVLIAIVTDSYGIIKNEKAAIVFWSDRLDFIAEMDAISYGPWKKMRDSSLLSERSERMNRESWDYKIWDLFTAELLMWDDITFLSIEFFVNLFLRGAIFLFIVLIWLPLGLITAGVLWPPQVRQWIFVQTHEVKSTGEVRELEKRSIEVQALRAEVTELQSEIVHEMTADRMEVVALKAQFGEMKNDLKKELKEIQTIVATLFDIQSSFQYNNSR